MIDQKLIDLIKTLSKAEKKNFNLFIRRNSSTKKEPKQLALFNIIQKTNRYDISIIQNELSELSNKNIHDLAVLLYKNILKSLRILETQNHELKIRELIDYSHILYKRGLFNTSLNLLSDAKSKAKKHQKNHLVYEIIDFEKKIESRHVTLSHQERANELTSEAKQVRKLIEIEGYWTELSLQLYDYYLKFGHSKNELESKQVEKLFFSNRPTDFPNDSLGFYEKLYQYQSHAWYYYIIQEFKLGYRAVLNWIKLFDSYPTFIEIEKLQLLKGYHNCLSILYYCQDTTRFLKINQLMNEFISKNELIFDRNTYNLSFVYKHLSRLNSIVLTGEFTKGKAYLNELEIELENKDHILDLHRKMVFHYKISTIYFTIGDYKKCLFYLNKIINDKQKSLHQDVQSFARILNLITHYELGNTELIFNQIKSVYRFLIRLEETQAIQNEILIFLKKVISVPLDKIQVLLLEFYNKLLIINENKFEKRVYLYLDIISWLESKLQNKLVETIIYEKRQKK